MEEAEREELATRLVGQAPKRRAQRGDEGEEGMWRKDEREELAAETQRTQRGNEGKEGITKKGEGEELAT